MELKFLTTEGHGFARIKFGKADLLVRLPGHENCLVRSDWRREKADRQVRPTCLGKSRHRILVAQVGNLLCRRLAVGWMPVFQNLRITNPRYGRLPVCATVFGVGDALSSSVVKSFLYWIVPA
jgi:hypothetical protein